MLRGILWAVLAVAFVFGGYFVWKQYHTTGDLGSGDVVSRKAPADDSSLTSNTDIDGNATPTPSRSDAPGTVNTAPAGPAASGAGNQLTTTQSAAPQDGTVAATPTGSMRAPDATTTYTQAAPAALPVADSVAPNPPNGMVFAGSGAYQWYRQGNITWRVDSKSGRACIAFATMEEWQKSIVINSGCGRIV